MKFDIKVPENLLRAGFPTFDQFAKNPDKYRKRDDDKFAEVDKGGKDINAVVQKHIYEIDGYRCNSLEEVERVAKNQGIPIETLDYQPEIVPNSGQKCDLYIKFVPKWERNKRAAWK